MVEKRSHKISRVVKDRRKRKKISDQYKGRKIVRGAPPTKEKKVLVTQQLVKDPKTGKAKYTDVISVKDAPRKSDGTLYIPRKMPEKERRYLRPVKPQFAEFQKKYPDPTRWGSLELYKKNRLLSIAKENYDLSENLAKHLSKDDIIRYIKKRHREGAALDEGRYLPREMKLMKVEPYRGTADIKYRPSKTADEPFAGTFEMDFGKRKIWDDPIYNKKTKKWVKKKKEVNLKFVAKGRGTDPESIQKNLDDQIKGFLKQEDTKGGGAKTQIYRTLRDMPKLGETRIMDKDIYNRFKTGAHTRREILTEVATHIDLPLEERMKLNLMTDDQLERLYKKAYKQSLKKVEEGRYERPFRFEKPYYEPNSPHFGTPPEMISRANKPLMVSKEALQQTKAFNIFDEY